MERNEEPAVAPIRVLHVINGEFYSGAERVQDLLGSQLPQFGVTVGFACVKPDRFPRMRRSQDVPLYEIPMRSRFDFRAVWRLVQIIRREGYQIVHAHTPRTALVGRIASAIAGVPMVYHVHSPASRDSTSRLRDRVNAFVERWSLTGVKKLIAVSKSLGRHMRQEGFSRDRVTVVPNGVPAAETAPRREAPQGQWTLGTVALFRGRKGTEILIEALALLRRKGLPVRLRAVGPFETPQYEHELKQRVVQLGLEDDVDWTGFTSDVNAELAEMDLFVLPSLFGEGLPMVVLEAMAAGVPVVGTDVEGVPEAIRDGLDGVIAKPGDAEDLAQSIERVINGELDWSDLRQSALTRHGGKFSDVSMAEGVAAAYRDVVK